MLILHVVGASLVRNTPARTARYWGSWTSHRGAALCIGRPGGAGQYKEPLSASGIYCAGGKRWKPEQRLPPAAEDMIASADVIHFHDDGYPSMIAGNKTWKDKTLVYHAHIGDLTSRVFGHAFDYDRRVKHACITNGYGRLFDASGKRTKISWGRLADIIEIDNPIYRPNPAARPRDSFRVVFTYSNRAERGARINAKAPEGTKALCKGIEGVDFRWVFGESFERSMAHKRAAHLVLDEVFSPYTHLSTLEGASAGTCVLVNYDDYTRNDLCDWLGAPRESYPFVRVTPETLRATIEHFRDHPAEAVERGRAARAWMERWYGTKRLLEKYVEFYKA